MILGIDTSTYLEEMKAGARYFKNGKEIDPLDLFVNQGVKYEGIRLWVDPYDKDGNPYLGGTCDLANFIALSKIVLKKGYHIVLDFHYSDFWVDPGKQFIPKSWQNLDKNGLIAKIYEYTKQTLLKIRDENFPLYGIQIGNEITNGMLYPVGQLIDDPQGGVRKNYDTLVAMLKNASKACREIFPETKLIIHLERSGDSKVYQEYFTKMKENNVDYDIIGASYYPYWHGTIEQVISNLVNLKKEFKKEVMFMELGYAFTLEDYITTYNGQNKQLVLNDDFVKDKSHYIPFPLSEDGQRGFLKKFIYECKRNGIDGLFYWEPLWIPGECICWTSLSGQVYINETSKSTRNEWANQALFDYKGN